MSETLLVMHSFESYQIMTAKFLRSLAKSQQRNKHRFKLESRLEIITARYAPKETAIASENSARFTSSFSPNETSKREFERQKKRKS